MKRVRIIDELSSRITRISNGKTLLLSLIGYMVVLFLINGQPFGLEALKDITGGVGILDMEILYTPQEAYTHLDAMGTAGRNFDLSHIVPLDLVFPFLYTLFYAVTISWLLKRWLPSGNGWHRLNIIPLIGGTGDYLENFGIITMLVAWPGQLPIIAGFTMVAGLFKFTFIIISMFIILGAFSGWIISVVTSRRDGSSGEDRRDGINE